ncbi:PTTG1IP [Cervus elaphus hippelaphus]|uniref:PTTG1IP n=1 Tax=Cervus elaphus hippelaphus TaxID=46360 RepID=A0A212CJK8_CEREH|nr:PTTG1IP [Cervus elaphus hippelaphus]
MASSGVRGPTPRWGPTLGGAALFLLLLPAAAAQGCSQNTSRTCEECLKNVSCLWCNTNKMCLDYPVTKVLPPSSLCRLSSARWGVCWGESPLSLVSCKTSVVLNILVVLNEGKTPEVGMACESAGV